MFNPENPKTSYELQNAASLFKELRALRNQDLSDADPSEVARTQKRIMEITKQLSNLKKNKPETFDSELKVAEQEIGDVIEI